MAICLFITSLIYTGKFVDITALLPRPALAVHRRRRLPKITPRRELAHRYVVPGLNHHGRNVCIYLLNS